MAKNKKVYKNKAFWIAKISRNDNVINNDSYLNCIVCKYYEPGPLSMNGQGSYEIYLRFEKAGKTGLGAYEHFVCECREMELQATLNGIESMMENVFNFEYFSNNLVILE